MFTINVSVVRGFFHQMLNLTYKCLYWFLHLLSTSQGNENPLLQAREAAKESSCLPSTRHHHCGKGVLACLLFALPCSWCQDINQLSLRACLFLQAITCRGWFLPLPVSWQISPYELRRVHPHDKRCRRDHTQFFRETCLTFTCTLSL